MHLEGACHCRSVRFSLESAHPVPYRRCTCPICGTTQGGGGYAVNLAGDAGTLKVRGRKHPRTCHAVLREGGRESRSDAERVFCGLCGSHPWLFDPDWPELSHPLARASDTALPVPPERTHPMRNHAAPWCEPTIAAWHERLGLEDRD